MSIAPIQCSIHVNLSPARAFEVFTAKMGSWWKLGKTPAPNPHADIVAEPFAGGMWYEVDAQGQKNQWGQVLAWEPPSRLVLGWQLNCHFGYDPDLLTEVEIRFTPADGGTIVALEHRNLERFGADGEALIPRIREGWPEKLSEFAAHLQTAAA